MKGHDPIVEKVGKAFRVRSRYLRVWLCVQRHAVQELIPMLRENAAYQRALDKVCPGLYLESNVAAE